MDLTSGVGILPSLRQALSTRLELSVLAIQSIPIITHARVLRAEFSRFRLRRLQLGATAGGFVAGAGERRLRILVEQEPWETPLGGVVTITTSSVLNA